MEKIVHDYETMFIVDATLEEDAVRAIADKFKALIEARMSHMLLVENSRLESIRHQTLRMMTINLEYLWELLANIEAAENKGEAFVYDPEHAVDRDEPVFKFLR